MADVTVSIDWTPRADVVELRGDMWHKACASCVPVCVELVRGTKTQELADVWRSVAGVSSNEVVFTDHK